MTVRCMPPHADCWRRTPPTMLRMVPPPRSGEGRAPSTGISTARDVRHAGIAVAPRAFPSLRSGEGGPRRSEAEAWWVGHDGKRLLP